MRLLTQQGPNEIISTSALERVYDMEITIQVIDGNRIGVYFA
jgi:ABC-type enterochelin transport system ATPase subunit